MDRFEMGIAAWGGAIINLAAGSIYRVCKNETVDLCMQKIARTPVRLTQFNDVILGIVGGVVGYAALGSVSGLCNTLTNRNISLWDKGRATVFYSAAALATGYCTYHIFNTET
ncbi:MAG: hypothetical protein JSR37_00990 [Verrucomicrobia bacterium]|nr:hypothetical protein [Verrucomicrobiota bacterium]MBS0636694.1 hypothetical protein [Verrucomicrobiota bacterium]